MANPVKRVLALHGYSQNAVVFSKRIGALRKESNELEFVFINAPHLLQAADLHGEQSQADAEPGSLADMQSNPETAMRGWWKANKERTKVTGLEESLLAIREVLKNQRFDGVFGFSQGAAFAAVISSLLERPELYKPFQVDGQPPHPPFEFCVAISGFRVLDPFCDPFFTPHYSTPTLHVIGKTDVVVINERSRHLVDVSANKRVEEHEGGHFVPSKSKWRKFLAAYMRDSSAPLASPTAISESATSSGTSTPNAGMSYSNAVLMKS
ncbi:serine hydrolase FSH [Crepidotus variabilis]|uniref:Serine hydrolase FSH n=1 Tax=Crepidotus variabilis TaxID=179855 RepID=A0A9P6EHL5_9AGAR|nr:serine hydrolase FSH [Crepidotus variabilis]